MGVGFRLKLALRERKMTIKELSEQTGISLNTLYSITKRDTENVDDTILSAISSTLGLSWSFFSSCSPFEDLEFLHENKTLILERLEEYGLISTETKPFDRISKYEFWEILSLHVFDVSKDDFGDIQVFCEFVQPYDPNSDVGTDTDKLLSIFTKLEAGGRALVIEYAELLASNPGFLRK